MQFTNRRLRRVGLDLTPLIDVVLMLVIFFMLTTTFVLSPGIQVDLPKGSTQQQPADNDAVIVMTSEGVVYFEDERIELQALEATLRQRFQLQPTLRVVVKADTAAQHGQVVEIMDMAKLIGIERLAIATAPKPQP